MDDHSAMLHAAHLRVAWADKDNTAIASQIAHITDLWDAQDIICALITATDVPATVLRGFLKDAIPFPDDGKPSGRL